MSNPSDPPATTGVHLPAIGLGTMRQHGDACRDVVEAALAAGYRHIDTARKYGNESEVGAGIARSSVPRDQIVVTTKLTSDDLAPAQVRAATRESLDRLQLEVIDLLLIHWPNPAVPLADTLGAMTALRDEGLVRAIGVANFPSALLREAVALTDIVTNQVEYHPYLEQGAVLDACREAGTVLTAYCPLARADELLTDPTVTSIAVGHGHTPAQVVLRWLVQQPGVVAIPGASDLAHLRENLAIEDFELDADAMATISGLARGGRVVDPPHAPIWD